MEKADILEAIKTIASSEGKPPGSKLFTKLTGIKKSDWYGRYWIRWGDAVEEAGLARNKINQATSKESVLSAYVELAVELDRLPVDGDIRMRARGNPEFPSETTITKYLGRKNERMKASAEFVRISGYAESVISYFESAIVEDAHYEPITAREEVPFGFVYLMKSGKFYKIGRTNSLDRRQYEIGIQMPEGIKPIHSIETDDPSGIEAYWHNRFKEKRMNGEWFQLDAADLRAFRKRRFM